MPSRTDKTILISYQKSTKLVWFSFSQTSFVFYSLRFSLSFTFRYSFGDIPNESNIFNLGNGVGYSVKEVIDKARKVTGHPIPAIETPKRAGDPARLVASSEKARKILGWNPVHDSLEEIISDAWNWHKNHLDGF